MHNITILTVSEVQDLHITSAGQVALDSIYSGSKGFFAVYETRID
jgi:hypothetical protein